eukprot:GHRR01026300.1.p1 GENE.GHRR01026300.1~~GHRR01026300.1.p1  ORF type:complete len:147 (+),score=24.36 GHRR01026300.1:97-537(+)
MSVTPAQDKGTLYHLVQKSLWESCKAGGKSYYPPTYEADGFIHLTKEAPLLLSIANHFYQSVSGDFIVLALDSSKLTSEVKFEAAAAVGNTEAPETQQLFPHLYGTINSDAVTQELPVQRSGDKTFLSIAGLPAAVESEKVRMEPS